jgi:hypothetical protein
MTFSEALEAMKAGSPVARAVWNIQPQKMALQLVHPILESAESVNRTPFICLFTSGQQTLHVVSDLPPFVERGKDAAPDLAPWVPSQQDMLADDWFVLKFVDAAAA